MGKLNFASYANIIKRGMTISGDLKVTQLLLNLIVENENVLNRNGESYFIDSKCTHKWLKLRQNLPNAIKKAADLPEIRAKAFDYFEEKVLVELNTKKEDDTYFDLLHLIKNDHSISPEKRVALLSLYEDNNLTGFLAETFLYAIQKDSRPSLPDVSAANTKDVDDDVCYSCTNDVIRNSIKNIVHALM